MNSIWHLGEPVEAHVFGLWVNGEIAWFERQRGRVGIRVLDDRKSMRGLAGGNVSMTYAGIRRPKQKPARKTAQR